MPSRPWTGAPSCAAPASASASAWRPRSSRLVRKAKAADAPAGGDAKPVVRRTVCSHCSVGCAVDAVVENGVWVRQEPVFDFAAQPRRPLRQGRRPARARPRRLSPQDADEAGRRQVPEDQLGSGAERDQRQDARAEEGERPDSIFVVGSSKHNNEQSYLLRKWVSLWGSNNCDHQARICHSTTVAGRREHVGLRRDDELRTTTCATRSARCTSARTPPRRTRSRCCTCCTRRRPARKMIVVDPRFTRTAAKADEYVRLRSGSDIAFLFGMLHHIFKNGWEDKKYIADRVYGMDKVRDGGAQQVDARQGPGRDRRRRGHGLQGREDDGRQPAEHHRLVHGPDPAHHRQRHRPRLLPPAARARQRRRERRRHQHLPRPRQRPGRDRRRPEPRLAARLLRPGRGLLEALRQGLGRRLRVDQEAVRARHDGQARHDGVALDRRRAREERADRPGLEPARPDLLGPCAELADPRPRDEDGDGQARPDGRHRSVSVGPAAMAAMPGKPASSTPTAPSTCCRRRRSSRPGLGDRVEPLAAMAREGDRAAVRVAHRPHDHVPAGAEARLRQGAGGQDQDGRRQGRA